MNINSYVTLAVAVFLLGSLFGIIQLSKKLAESRQETSIAVSNMKAYQGYGDSIKNRERELLLTVDQLKNSNDKLDKELYATAKELKLKDREIVRLMGIIGVIGKKDTIIFRDTIFREDLELDTTLNYKPHYTLDLSLKYPNRITVHPSFYMKLEVITSLQKETIQPPHKFFLVRWFQRKHNVVVVDLVNKNPYVTLEKTRFIDIKK